MDAREAVRQRSGGRCEAMVRLPRAWSRCGRTSVEMHHALKRSRGGAILDEHGEIYHLIDLCRAHHHYAETSGDYTSLIIDGYVTTENGVPVYEGPDEYLRKKYGRAARSVEMC